ncbi:Putative exopolyphosphatase [Termitomyces sp. J132]|nr:Putative exopolyphosphatase [Termitomyces sp. J132]
MQPKEQLLFLTDLAPFSLTAPTAAFLSYTFALVDHNTLASAYTFQNSLATVTNILNHHADKGNHLNASPHIIIPLGSCTSYVSALFPPEIPTTLATLLLTRILIDTNSLKPGGKALNIDHTAMAFLAPHSTLASQLFLTSISSPCANAFTQLEVLYNTTTIKDLTHRLNNSEREH